MVSMRTPLRWRLRPEPTVLVAGTAIFGERETVGAAMHRLRASLGQLEKQPIRCDDAREEGCHAAWNDWTRTDGREHGPPASAKEAISASSSTGRRKP